MKEFQRGWICLPRSGLTESSQIRHIGASIFLVTARATLSLLSPWPVFFAPSARPDRPLGGQYRPGWQPLVFILVLSLYILRNEYLDFQCHNDFLIVNIGAGPRTSRGPPQAVGKSVARTTFEICHYRATRSRVKRCLLYYRILLILKTHILWESDFCVWTDSI